MSTADFVLSGIRPTGRLHLGHQVGAIDQWLKIQASRRCAFLLADVQALTDNAEEPDRIRRSVSDVTIDLLATGIDPDKCMLFIQSGVPELYELTIHFMNVVSDARVRRNPTVASELERLASQGKSPTAGFTCYPISQAADILFVSSAVSKDGVIVVPAGDDQAPMVEITNEIANTVNRLYGHGKVVLARSKLEVSHTPRLVGTDGNSKMSKSLGNTISLCDSDADITKAVKKMPSDSSRKSFEDPGDPDKAVAFTYLRAFDPDKTGLLALERDYRAGGVRDGDVKERLMNVLKAKISPIRARRLELESDPQRIMQILREGTERARSIAAATLNDLRRGMRIDYFT